MKEPDNHELSNMAINEYDDLPYLMSRVEDLPMVDVPVSNLYSGAAMTSGCNRIMDDTKNSPKKVDKVRGFPLGLFADGAASDLFGALSSIPFSMVPGFHNTSQRTKEVTMSSRD